MLTHYCRSWRFGSGQNGLVYLTLPGSGEREAGRPRLYAEGHGFTWHSVYTAGESSLLNSDLARSLEFLGRLVLIEL